MINSNNHWKELVAALGIILSLVFVGYEINQNTHVSRAEARSELSDATAEWVMTLATNNEVRDLWFSTWDLIDQFEYFDTAIEGEHFTPSQARQFSMLLNHNMRRFENVYFQYAEGLIDESALSSYGMGPLPARYQSSFFRTYWEEVKGVYDAGFVEYWEAQQGI